VYLFILPEKILLVSLPLVMTFGIIPSVYKYCSKNCESNDFQLCAIAVVFAMFLLNRKRQNSSRQFFPVNTLLCSPQRLHGVTTSRFLQSAQVIMATATFGTCSNSGPSLVSLTTLSWEVSRSKNTKR